MPPNNTYPNPSIPQGFDSNVPTVLPKRRRNSLLIPFILSVLFVIGLLGFGIWAFTSRADYKNNSDQKAAVAVEQAEAVQKDKLQKEFAEAEKLPLKTYKGPATYGSLGITYPKTWSAYVIQVDRGSTPLDGYVHPDVVPGTQSGTAYALRFQVTNTAYDQELKQFQSQVTAGKVTISALQAAKVSNVTGVRITGEIENGKQGVMVLFPLRDKTLKISTEASTFVADFDNTILPNLTFVP